MKRAMLIATNLLHTGMSIIIAVMVITLAPIIGADLEGSFAPVIEQIKMTPIDDGNTTYGSFKVTGDKVRACKFIEVRALVLIKDEWVNGLVSFASDANSAEEAGTTRSTGKQSFGVWRIRPDGAAMKFEIVHSCHFGYDTVTKLGTWEVK